MGKGSEYAIARSNGLKCYILTRTGTENKLGIKKRISGLGH